MKKATLSLNTTLINKLLYKNTENEILFNRIRTEKRNQDYPQVFVRPHLREWPTTYSVSDRIFFLSQQINKNKLLLKKLRKQAKPQ